MSRGHTHGHDLKPDELDDLLSEALGNPKIKRWLARPYKLDSTYDIPLLGSSSVGGTTVYLDRHLKVPGKPMCVLPLQGRWINVKQPLIRHERLEQALEDVLGWPYETLAHPVAEHWEEQLVAKMGFDPKKYEKMLAPFIKSDEKEKVTRVPTDLDARPVMSNSEPEDKAILKHSQETDQKEKLPQNKVAYVTKSAVRNQSCSKCVMFIDKKYGGPACTLVRSPISPAGWCRRFSPGSLGEK